MGLGLWLLGQIAIGQTRYSVREFGAAGDGKTKDTAAFQRAMDTCAVNGAGVFVMSHQEKIKSA